MGRRVYLKKMSVADARRAWRHALAGWTIDRGENLYPADAVGRITRRAVFARRNAPAFASAAMDGIAVMSSSTFGASETNPVTLKPEEFVEINTGNPMPPGMDSVVMVEDLNPAPCGGFVISKASAPWRNVRQIGENAVAGSMLLPRLSRISPEAAALLVSAGVFEVEVLAKPRVAIIPTGDELAPPRDQARNKVPETNSILIEGRLRTLGAETTVFPIVPDDPEAIASAVASAAADFDMVLLNAGSSAGSRDYAADVVQRLGSLVVHGVGIRPGKPLLLGVVDGKPLAGLPGYPLAALVDLETFVEPLVRERIHASPFDHAPPSCSATIGATGDQADMDGTEVRPDRRCRRRAVASGMIRARAATVIPSRLGDEEHVRGKLAFVGDDVLFHPLPRGSASLVSAVRADAVTVIPGAKEGIDEGEELEAGILQGFPGLERSVVAVGSHDLLLDLLSDELRGPPYPLFLDSIHVGSMGGLRAMSRGTAHMAGIHLLDPENGLYNIPFLDRLLPDRPCALLHLCTRQQGLMVQKGNPRGISGLADLPHSGHVFVNRQQGSGTRLLLDIKLKELGIDAGDIEGFGREETTHIGVAVRVANGAAHCGLGIFAAARALDLDFIPVEEEQYDLLLDWDFYTSDACGKLVELLRSGDFRKRAEAFGGYDCSSAGELRVERRP